MIGMAWLWACASSPPPAEAPPDEEGAGLVLTAFEASLVEPILESVRAGVRPWSPEGLGVCRGARTCEEYLGADVAHLDAGEYLVRAELSVPPVGRWTVEFESTCVVDGADPVVYRRTYELAWPGADRPFRIGALRRFTVPSPAGPESCTYRLLAPHPDGDRELTGSWSTR